mgnify:CR=1 FL=1
MQVYGSSVKDAEEDLLLTITPGDVREASPLDPTNCAIAKACRRQEQLEALIHITRVYLRNGGKDWVRYVLPNSLRGEIIAHDRGGVFKPGSYVLMAPSKSEKLGGHRGIKRQKKPSGKLRRKPIYTGDIRPSMVGAFKRAKSHGPR